MNLKPDSLLEDFLAAVHQLKFSKVSEATDAVDVERRCVITKFLASKQFDSEDAAAAVLQRGLQSYQSQMENKSSVNNYWRQVKAFTSKVTNDPLQWKSCLTDPSVALQVLKPLPCQFVNTNSCKNLEITDKHVEDVISAWKLEDRQSRKRKIATHNRLNLRFNSSNGNDNSSLNLQGISHSKGALQCKEDNRRQVPQLNLGSNDSNNVKEKLINVQKSSYFKPKLYSKSALRGSMNSQENIEENEAPEEKVQLFKTARQELKVQQSKMNRQSQGKTLENKRTVNSKFVCPFKRERENVKEAQGGTIDNPDKNSELEDERLKNIEPKMVELIKNEIMDSGSIVSWDEIAGLEYAKKTIQEIVVFPMLRPDIFTGLRRPPKGILLFGPPGTGKTLIGKCIASQSKSTFFSISASSLTSKWIGEGEKMVRALFAVARVYQPAVIFIDEIDSLLSQRSDSEHESSRRIKTEFLVQLDGATTAEEDRILVVGATNRPQELDEAARRRLVKRLYIPLPELEARKQIISNLLASEYHNLTLEEMCTIAKLSEGYSGADMTNLCKEASMGPIRSIPFSQLENISKEDVRQVTLQDFKQALSFVRSSVSQADLSVYVDWDRIYGTGSAQNCTL